MEMIKLKLKSAAPMLMHSDRFADPLNQLTKAHKELTSKRKKTDEDHAAIARSEYMGALYIDRDGPFIPSINLESCIGEAARMQKLGRHVKRGVMVMEDKLHLAYDGPRTADALADDPVFRDVRSVRVSMARLMRYRPRFNDWSAECTVAFDAEQINENELRNIIEQAGKLVGLGDFRPKFGRFSVEFVGA
jgi:hypothetical protein